MRLQLPLHHDPPAPDRDGHGLTLARVAALRRPLAVGLVVCAAAFGATGCGGDDSGTETEFTTPELTVPGGASATIPDDTTTTGTTTGGAAGTGTPAPGQQRQSSPGQQQQQGGQNGNPGGGPAGGAQPPDNSQNDTPPPQGSPAERFEQFCQDNPGAC